MPVIVTCPTCGQLSQVQEQSAGTTVSCPHCAALMSVPDAQSFGAHVPGTRPELTDPYAPTETTDFEPPALTRTPSYFNVVNPTPTTYTCNTCGGMFPPDQTFELDGAVICHDCYANAAAHAAQAQAEAEAEAARAHAAAEAAAAAAAEPEMQQDERGAWVPETSFAGAASAARDHVAAAEDEAPHELAAAAVQSSASSSSPGRAARRGSPDWLVWVMAGSFGVILIAAILIFMNSSSSTPPPQQTALDVVPPPPTLPDRPTFSAWEAVNAPHIERMRSQAKSLEASGDLVGAYGKYQEMLNLASSSGTAPKSAALSAELDEARRAWESLSKRIPSTELASVTPPVGGTATPTPTPTPAPSRDPSPATSPSDSTTPSPTKVPTPPATGPTPAPPDEPPTPTPPPAVATDNGPWEPAHRDQVLDLLTQADALAKGKQVLAALEKYKELSLLVGDHRKDIKDPDLKAKLAAGEESRRQLLATARDSDETRILTARALLLAGLKSENDGKWKTGLESVSDARRLMEKVLQGVARYRDNDYLTALHAMAVAYLRTQQTPRAGELFADTEPLGKIASGPNADPPRALVWNRAINDVTQKFNVMRTVKSVRDYMAKHKENDEELLNLLGTSLSLADENAPSNRKLLDECIGFYGQRNMDLERTRPGQRRWGVQWLPDAEAQAKFDEQNKALEAWQNKLHEKAAAAARVKAAEDAARPTVGRGRPAGSEAAVNAAKQDLERITREAAAARAAIPRAPWLTDLKPMVPTYDPQAVAAVVPPTPTPAPTSKPAPADNPSSGDTTPPPQVADTKPPVAPTPPPAPVPQPPPPPPVVIRAARYALAFPVDKLHLVTAAEPLGNAKVVRMEDTQGNVIPARVVATHDRLALLEVESADVNGAMRYMNLAADYAGGAARCVAIPEANLFGPAAAYIPTENIGPAKTSVWSVGLVEHPRLPGAPLIDAHNDVIGVVVAQRDDVKQKLPAVPIHDLQEFLRSSHAAPASPCANPDPLAVYQVAAEGE